MLVHMLVCFVHVQNAYIYWIQSYRAQMMWVTDSSCVTLSQMPGLSLTLTFIIQNFSNPSDVGPSIGLNSHDIHQVHLCSS